MKNFIAIFISFVFYSSASYAGFDLFTNLFSNDKSQTQEQLDLALIDCVKQMDYRCTKKLLKKGAQPIPRKAIKDHYPSLLYAAGHRAYDIVKLLINTDPSQEHLSQSGILGSIFEIASEKRDTELLEYLEKDYAYMFTTSQSKFGLKAFLRACSSNNEAAINFFIDRDISFLKGKNISFAIDEAVINFSKINRANNDINAFDVLIQKLSENHLLDQAVVSTKALDVAFIVNKNIVPKLLKINPESLLALQPGPFNRSFIEQKLTDSSNFGDVNMLMDSVTSSDLYQHKTTHGQSLLHVALFANDIGMLRLFLERTQDKPLFFVGNEKSRNAFEEAVFLSSRIQLNFLFTLFAHAPKDVQKVYIKQCYKIAKDKDPADNTTLICDKLKSSLNSTERNLDDDYL